MTAVALEVVHEHLGDNRGALVVLETDPRRNVLIDARGGPAARAPIAIHIAQIADGAAHVDPPLVLELTVKVGVRRSIRRKPVARGPELPPVEIPKCPLEQLVRFLRAFWNFNWWQF